MIEQYRSLRQEFAAEAFPPVVPEVAHARGNNFLRKAAIACVLAGVATVAAGQSQEASAQGIGYQPTEAEMDSGVPIMCRSYDGLSLVSQDLGSLNVRKAKGSPNAIKVHLKTEDATECDPFGKRTINEYSFFVKGNAHKKWKKTKPVVSDLEGNGSTTVNKKIKLPVKCSGADKKLVLKAYDNVSYLDYPSGETLKRVEKNKYYKIKLPC